MKVVTPEARRVTRKRGYTMRARATSVDRTRERILDATVELSADHVVPDITLELVAGRAGVSVQTVLRHFGSRAGLIRAAIGYGAAKVAEERRAPAGDLPEAIRLLLDHYEKRGDGAVLLLAQEGADPTIRAVVESGREVHRSWVTESFGPQLNALAPQHRTRTTDLLVVVTDVYTWKQLRRDHRLSRRVTESRITSLVTAVLSAAGEGTGEGSRHG